MATKSKLVGTTTIEAAPAPSAKPMKSTTRSKTPAKKAKAPAASKLSALDAAAKVLDETREPMTSVELIEAIAKKGYWSSPNGQTPEATLYSAIIREISQKGKASRFAKAEPGKFARTKAR